VRVFNQENMLLQNLTGPLGNVFRLANRFAQITVVGGDDPEAARRFSGQHSGPACISKTIFDLWLITKTEIAYSACNVM
jgi:hypothetical protein